MASGGITDGNVDESSDILHDFPCKPCSDDGKNIEGVHFCAECQTYFCQACVAFHNKCFKTHTLYNKSGVKSGSAQYHQQTGGLTCDKHPGNPIQMYCGEHDTVSCAVCIAVDHRLCNSADFIPKLSKEILNGRDKNDVKISLEEMKKKLHSVKSSKLEQMNEISKEKEDLLTEIEKMKERIIARVEEIEKTSVKQVQDKHKVIVDRIKTDIESVDANVRAIESNIQKINEFKGNNEAKLFVVLNKAHEVESSSIKYLENSELVRYGKIVFDFNQNIESVFSKLESLGTFNADGNVEDGEADVAERFSDASLVDGCNIERSSTSSYAENVTDICMLGNGQIIVVSSEGYLKRLDKTFNLADECYLGSGTSPTRLCRVRPKALAVLCRNRVQFVYAGKSMMPTLSFTIPVKEGDRENIYPLVKGMNLNSVYCTGISYNNEKLYISVTLEYQGNFMYDMYKYAVLVYDMKGCHLQTVLIEIESEGNSEVKHACISSDGSCMYVATRSRGLITLNMTGEVVAEATHEMLKNAGYVCEGSNGQLFVCGKDSHNIFLVSRHGEIIEEVLGMFDGINDPLSCMYVKHQKRLVVTSTNGVVQVFQLT